MKHVASEPWSTSKQEHTPSSSFSIHLEQESSWVVFLPDIMVSRCFFENFFNRSKRKHCPGLFLSEKALPADFKTRILSSPSARVFVLETLVKRLETRENWTKNNKCQEQTIKNDFPWIKLGFDVLGRFRCLSPAGPALNNGSSDYGQ